MKPSRTTLLALACASLTALQSFADTLIFEPFDGNSLPGGLWSYAFVGNTANWTYGVSGGLLTVTDIVPTAYPPGCDVSGGTWSDVYLEHPIAPGGDFSFSAQTSWDSVNSNATMQQLLIELVDCHNNTIASVGLSDAWIGGKGARVAQIGSQWVSSGFNTVPFAGSAVLDISRVGAQWTASFGGQQMLAGNSPGVPTKLRLVFSYYASHACAGGNTIFGTETVDYVQVTGTPGAANVADLTGDQAVDGADLGQLLGAWGGPDCAADLNHDGIVDGADLGFLLGEWTT